jgi:hypothetical protein
LLDLGRLFADARRSMRADGWIVVEASNFKQDDGHVTTLAWDLARAIGELGSPTRLRFGTLSVSNASWQPLSSSTSSAPLPSSPARIPRSRAAA